jgi:hypothetical protein
MRSLNEYIQLHEGILDSIDKQMRTGNTALKNEIKEFLKKTYNGHTTIKISRNPNKDGVYEIWSERSISVKDKSITSLTNGNFIWVEVGGDFSCHGCRNLKSLEGSPKRVNGAFCIDYCSSIKTLEGMPEFIRGIFNCHKVTGIKNLKGIAQEILGGVSFWGCENLVSIKEAKHSEILNLFSVNYCIMLKSLEGCPKMLSGTFSCDGCVSITSLKGCPEHVEGRFMCRGCGVDFTREDVEKVCRVTSNSILTSGSPIVL